MSKHNIFCTLYHNQNTLANHALTMLLSALRCASPLNKKSEVLGKGFAIEIKNITIVFDRISIIRIFLRTFSDIVFI